jgi:hypothetical protein
MDASQDRRKGRIRWLTLPVKDVSRTCIMRPTCKRTLTTMPPTVIEEATEKQARSETEILTKEQYLLVNTKHLLLISFQIITYANLIF